MHIELNPFRFRIGAKAISSATYVNLGGDRLLPPVRTDFVGGGCCLKSLSKLTWFAWEWPRRNVACDVDAPDVADLSYP